MPATASFAATTTRATFPRKRFLGDDVARIAGDLQVRFVTSNPPTTTVTLLTSTQFFSFLGASILITVSPGPDNLMVLSIGASRGDAPWQIVQLGVTFTLQGALLFGMLGYFGGLIGQWLNRHEGAGLWLDRVAGTIFVGLGLKLIVSR
jgi:hypothetical protein